MTAQATARASSDGTVGLVLPADWWVVPLVDEAGCGRVVAALVEHQVGGGDARAAMRRQLRVEVGAAARRAAASSGWVMAFMLRAGDQALPATMTGYRSAGSFRDEAGVADVRAALEDVTAATGGCLDAGAGPFGIVLRSVRERTGTWHGVTDLPVLVCDYWTDPDDGHGLVHLCFTTPLVGLRDAFGELFDAVAQTLHRVGPHRADEPADEAADEPADEPAAVDRDTRQPPESSDAPVSAPAGPARPPGP